MKKLLLIGGVAATIMLLGAGCAELPSEAVQVQQNQDKLAQAVPLPQLNNSLERTNISKRLSTFDDPNKVSYIYLVNYGRVMAFYTIKGKVTSGGKRLTSTEQPYDWTDEWASSHSTLKEAPELDGTYGSSNPYIFFWDTDGVYHQTTMDYLLVDQPQQLTSQPEIVRQIK